jgi:hypothetical protein
MKILFFFSTWVKHGQPKVLAVVPIVGGFSANSFMFKHQFNLLCLLAAAVGDTEIHQVEVINLNDQLSVVLIPLHGGTKMSRCVFFLNCMKSSPSPPDSSLVARNTLRRR